MEVDSLAGLKAAFEAWRSRKQHPREKIPADLVERVRAAARIHGWSAVGRAAKVERARLEPDVRGRGQGSRRAKGAPGYSQREATPRTAPTTRPFAALRTPAQAGAGAASIVPAYSRVEVAPPAPPSALPFAEVETSSGLKVRLFTETGGALGLLSVLLGADGAR